MVAPFFGRVMLVWIVDAANNIKFDENNSLVPMVGLIHCWKFDQPADLAVGAYYVYKKYSFYLWGNDFFTDYPRLTVAVDFT